ncbi:hypothetical protein BT69DRAFT_1285493 [Atractiella rhizophila]|nr:hypothetical protein BT69DRAFT_1285493 [Atractiella rhizophila]
MTGEGSSRCSPTLRHLLSPRLPSHSASHPCLPTFTLHLPFHQPLRLFTLWPHWAISFCWQSTSVLTDMHTRSLAPPLPFPGSPTPLLSHSTGPPASTKPVARKLDSEWRLNVRKPTGEEEIITEEGKVCSVASRTTSGHLGWSFSCS